MQQMLDVRQAAEEAGCFSAFIYAAIGRGKLKVQREGRRVFIPRQSFEEWKARLDTRRRIAIEERKLVEANS